MTEVVRPYRGVSAQTRRTERRTRLLEACLDVVGAAGVADTTVEAVCARAGLSKRYFYESFADRETVLVAALDQVFADVQAAITAALVDAPDNIDRRVTRTVTALVQSLAADQRKARLYIEAARYPTLEQRRIAAFDDFALLLLQHVLDADPTDVRARAMTLLIVAGTTEVLSRWLAGDLPIDERGLVEAISALGATAPIAQYRAPSRRRRPTSR